MDQRVIELALEALEARKAQIDREIAQLRGGTGARNSQSQRMTEYWAQRLPAAPKRQRPRTAAQKKAQSERMKAYWAKRKAAEKRSNK
jgi:hypothetical protein